MKSVLLFHNTFLSLKNFNFLDQLFIFLVQVSIGLTALVSDQVSKRLRKKKVRQVNPDGTEEDEDAEEDDSK